MLEASGMSALDEVSLNKEKKRKCAVIQKSINPQLGFVIIACRETRENRKIIAGKVGVIVVESCNRSG